MIREFMQGGGEGGELHRTRTSPSVVVHTARRIWHISPPFRRAARPALAIALTPVAASYLHLLCYRRISSSE